MGYRLHKVTVSSSTAGIL